MFKKRIINFRQKVLVCGLFFCAAPLLTIYLILTLSLKQKGLVLGISTPVSETAEVLSAETEDFNIVASTILSDDSVPTIIEKYLKNYNSPLLPFKDEIISLGQKYKVDPKLVVAIAQQESNLGKSSPENCFNAWGWGIHASGRTCFSSWSEAIETVIKGLAKSYCSKGLCEDPCVMMKKYTPKSNGSWCFGVNQFLAEMESGNF